MFQITTVVQFVKDRLKRSTDKEPHHKPTLRVGRFWTVASCTKVKGMLTETANSTSFSRGFLRSVCFNQSSWIPLLPHLSEIRIGGVASITFCLTIWHSRLLHASIGHWCAEVTKFLSLQLSSVTDTFFQNISCDFKYNTMNAFEEVCTIIPIWKMIMSPPFSSVAYEHVFIWNVLQTTYFQAALQG